MNTSSNKVQVTFDLQGHRGCRGVMPENTMPAMLHALELGVTTLEMDIVFTKDGVALLSHEPFFNHEITTLPDGSFIEATKEKAYNIYNMSFAETRQFDVGMKPHPRFPQQQKLKVQKPSLEALFDSVATYCHRLNRPLPYFNIETKTTPATDNLYHPEPAAFVDQLMRVIQSKGMMQRVMIQSFDHRTLQYLHQQYPSTVSVLLIEEDDTRTIGAHVAILGFLPDVISPHYSLVTKDMISSLHAHNRSIIPWTVNDSATFDRLKAAGVDGIITDFPNLFNH